jgi:hypothetical protein
LYFHSNFNLLSLQDSVNGELKVLTDGMTDFLSLTVPHTRDIQREWTRFKAIYIASVMENVNVRHFI